MDRALPVMVLAEWDVAREDLDPVLARLADVADASRAEPGCTGYDVYLDPELPGRIVLAETYASAEAVEAHKASPHYREHVLGAIVPRLVRRRVRVLRRTLP